MTHSVSGTTKNPLVAANARAKIIFRLRISVTAKRKADANMDRKTQRFVLKANPSNFERRVDSIDVAVNILLKLDYSPLFSMNDKYSVKDEVGSFCFLESILVQVLLASSRFICPF